MPVVGLEKTIRRVVGMEGLALSGANRKINIEGFE